jgi:hypothetical protein
MMRFAMADLEDEVRMRAGKRPTASSNTLRRKTNSSEEYTVCLPNIVVLTLS